MNLSFEINSQEGDKVIVSLFSSYSYLKDLLPDYSQNFELVEVSIIRKEGEAPIKVEIFGKIADILVSIVEDNPNTVLFYYCDIVEDIPHPRSGRNISSHKYRNNLFKLLFQRYSDKASERWSDIEVILRSQEPRMEMYAHFFVRDKHLPIVDLLRNEVLNNFKMISEQK